PPTTPLSLHDALPIYRRFAARRAVIRRSDANLYHARNALQLRQLPEDRQPPRRSSRMGAKNPRENTHLAALYAAPRTPLVPQRQDRKSTRLNSSHQII